MELEESFFHPGFPHFFLRYLLMVPESYSPTTNLLPPMTVKSFAISLRNRKEESYK